MANDLRAFQLATSAVPQYRAAASELTAIVRRLATWSVDNCPPLRYAPKGEKDQSSVSFVFAHTSRVLWMAYPASKQGDPKLEFLVRANKYSTSARVAEFREQLVSRGVRSSVGAPNAVLSVALKALRDPLREQATFEFLEWALALPDLRTAGA
ncbi:MAG: hypothetical protein Q8K82_19070 [Gemmatimonadaceae bacterium]|nr:hypothetical protein [Gemmatimonadaceae bacterium]